MSLNIKLSGTLSSMSVEEEEEEEEEELWYVRCLPNWDEVTHQSDPEWSSDSETYAYPQNV